MIFFEIFILMKLRVNLVFNPSGNLINLSFNLSVLDNPTYNCPCENQSANQYQHIEISGLEP